MAPLAHAVPEQLFCSAPQINPTRTPKHSPTSSYSSSSSSRNHHRSSNQQSISQLPIGIGHPHTRVHSHNRTSSGGPPNSRGPQGRITAPSAPSFQPAVSIETATRSTLPSFASTRIRSHSNAIPSSMKQFHLPTGMIHRSQSHAQLGDGVLSIGPLTSESSVGPLNAASRPVVSGGTLRRMKSSTKSIVSPPISQSHSNAPSYASSSFASKEKDEMDSSRIRPSGISQSHIRQTSEILDSLESRVPSLSSSFCRDAVYIDSEDISEKLDELLWLAKEEVEGRVLEEEDETEEMTVERGMVEGEQWADMEKSHRLGTGSINQKIASPPNTPATGNFGSTSSVAGSFHAASSGSLSGPRFYASPEGDSSQVYLGGSPSHSRLSSRNLNIVQDLPPAYSSRIPGSEFLDPNAKIDELHTAVPEKETASAVCIPFTMPSPPPEQTEEEEMMEDALALARDLAVEDRMIWGVRRNSEKFDDCWSEFEDEEMGVGVCPSEGGLRMNVRPGIYGTSASGREGSSNDQEGRIRFTLGADGQEMHDVGLAPPSMSKWSLTSSIDEEQRSLDGKVKKEKKRRSFVPFILSGDKDKELKDDGTNLKEDGTIGKKRSRLASFISRLSSVGFGGSGSNTPSTRTPPMPTLSASNSSHALYTLSSALALRESPSLPALTPNFSASPSRSSSPTALPDSPQLQPRVTIVEDDDHLNSFPSSPRLSLHETGPDSASLPTTTQLVTPPPPNVVTVKISRRPIPPGIVIPPLPTRPPPGLPSMSFPLGKAASEGMISTDSPGSEASALMSRSRSNSAADLFGKHVTFLPTPSSSSPRIEQASMTLPSTLRRTVLSKSASASVLGLHQQLKPLSQFGLFDTASVSPDDGLVPPTPTSMISTEEYGEARRRDDIYDSGLGLHPKRPRLRAMSSLGALPLNPKSKGGLKAFVGRLTGRGKITAKANPSQVHISLDDPREPELSTPTVTSSQKTPTPKHSPSTSFSVSASGSNISPASGGGGMLSGLLSYLEKSSLRPA